MARIAVVPLVGILGTLGTSFVGSLSVLLVLAAVTTSRVACLPDTGHLADPASSTTLQASLPPLRFPKGPDLDRLRAADPLSQSPGPSGSAADPGGSPTAAPATASPAPSTASSATTRPPGQPTRPPTSRAPAATASANVTATTYLTVNTVAAAAAASSTPAADRRPFVEPTKSAGILVGVFVSIAVLGYAGLLVWRRILERRYGNREILVNEEQFEHERDLSNFQL